MRDLGYDFYWYDQYCNNLFARGFETQEYPENNYDFITSFELFEHFANPLNEIENILNLSSNVLFSTRLLPSNNPQPHEWWYYSLEEGQHICFYTSKSLSILAEKFNLNLYSNDYSLHLLTRKQLEITSDFWETIPITEPAIKNKHSLLDQDYLKIIGRRATSPLSSNSY
ncbi:MAG: class I SAM-dependent methyltransferase [Okeania sp. SIO2G4]|uniref:class I SAM-dependent methyltransferase n=1 Tax=unclassified Okeania TaxID=2634635 RepID=UPI0013BC1372|nr:MULTISPECIES: class I SAM-dependent methyltransferase [unclassified Okeania]NEP43034.1 class I SAM-dependent methyltransferase [Okeania sp. SIO2H7]NEP71046.1 class I SAM-dependent methyltransferase [Okeania sp. SIO2G5]NEP91534.1 class I SAM-dependent methyltransferase [Okeania sp. SIO2F5]NEQ89410.1 class I SAM-dependent methyltransferase [Okeania sp. SIO2G4]